MGDAVIARYSKNKKNFEILVDCEKAMDFKKGKISDVREVLLAFEVFKNAKTGERAGDLKETFGTDDIYEIAEKIIKHGEIQLSAEYRRKVMEEKKKEIISLIAKNAIDPKTNMPIPPKRIELAMEQAGVRIDPFLPAEEQVKDVVDAICTIMPIRVEERRFYFKIPAKYTGKVFNILKLGRIVKEEWKSDGSLEVEVQISVSAQDELLEKLNKLTRGEVESKIIS